MLYPQNKFFTSLLFCAILTACQAPKSVAPTLSEAEIEQEEAVQKRMKDEIKAQGGVPKSWKNQPRMRAQFEAVGQRIEKAGAEICRELKLQENGCYYYFKLSRNEDINASADGENIVINTGMMRFVKSDDELAVVMAHEFAHNLMGHVKAQKNNATLGMIAGVALEAIADSQGVNMHGEMSKTGAEFAALRYSADFEKEADYVGLYVMARAGYDSKQAQILWRKMAVQESTGFISMTHPTNAERSAALQKTVTEILQKRQSGAKLLPDFN